MDKFFQKKIRKSLFEACKELFKSNTLLMATLIDSMTRKINFWVLPIRFEPRVGDARFFSRDEFCKEQQQNFGGQFWPAQR